MTGTKILQLLAAFILMGLLWAGLDGAHALSLLRQADAGWLVAALLVLTVQTVLSAYRWQFTARQLGQSFSLRHSISEYYLSQIVNQSLPGGVLGDAGRALRARHDGGLQRAGAGVVIERALGQASLLVILATAFLVPTRPDLPLAVQGIITLLLAGGVMIVGALYGATFITGHIGKTARSCASLIRRALLDNGSLPRQIVLNLSITAANIAAFAFCARATGTMMSASQAALLVPLILLTMIIPLTISGWGVREGAAAALFPLIGATGAAGLAASTAFGLMFLVSTLPGLLVLILQSRTSLTSVPPQMQVDP
ncbi:lysylphosphatidylglycerol synthase transmembrane domain-containing protein [Paracoccus sp. JM45]|uniref:lysylphosphatidylglycerol synthase transmembrane domain-containing protein n=1 Tax=Paracoccus sp. JM45 TaxID=2283626 RepID=UPI000E6C3C70|nr:lysylphosphatidylglycerol synthase transmembrane domain-containing protein [Paracoccus sp. JM45]RJE80282.1 UPF0104 family protein [Paracoccus sp. JM45]